MAEDLFAAYIPKIRALPCGRALTKEDLMTATFLLEKAGNVEIYYAPHNEWINEKARVVFVGITPGWTQMKRAFEQVRDDLQAGVTSREELAQRAKRVAAFAGSMRTNLIEMLDACGMAEALGIESTARLFDVHANLLHTTSVLKYPVFVKGKNYTGHTPDLLQSDLLRSYALEGFREEMQKVNSSLLVPLGKSVEQVLAHLQAHDQLGHHQYLHGFPHPSGANGHRKKQFAAEQEQLTESIRRFFGNA